MRNEAKKEIYNSIVLKLVSLVFVLTIIGLIALLFWVWPQYKVWQQEMTGSAKLARATQERKILIEQANAEREASILRAKAEKEAATHRAEAIQIMGQAAKDFPEYREQEFIQAMGIALNSGQIEQIIYVPTEANIPILEAGKR